MASRSRGREACHLEGPLGGPRAELRSGLPFAHPAALLDAGPGADPLVGGIHQPGELVVGHDPVGHGQAGSEKSVRVIGYLDPEMVIMPSRRKGSAGHPLTGAVFERAVNRWLIAAATNPDPYQPRQPSAPSPCCARSPTPSRWG